MGKRKDIIELDEEDLDNVYGGLDLSYKKTNCPGFLVKADSLSNENKCENCFYYHQIDNEDKCFSSFDINK